MAEEKEEEEEDEEDEEEQEESVDAREHCLSVYSAATCNPMGYIKRKANMKAKKGPSAKAVANNLNT